MRSAVQAGFGVAFISRRAVESELAAGTLAEARVKGLDLARDIYIAAPPAAPARAPRRRFVAFAREKLAA